MSQAIDAVLAGTKGFAVALLAPLTARIGNRPRVAGDPAQVLALCSGPSALAVVEFLGEGSIPTIQVLVRDGRGLRIVAGVPAAHASAESTLRALGVEIGRWDGKTDGVIAAVERVVATMGGAAAPAPARPLAAPAPAPAPTRPPAPATARPTAPPPSGAAGPPRAGAIPPGKPVTAAPGGSTRQVNAPSAARSAPAPVPAPAAAAPRPGPVAPVAVRPGSSAPPVAQARAAAPRSAPAVAAAVAIPLEPRAAPPAPVPPVAAPAPQAAPASHLFDDLDADVNVDVADLAAPAPPVDFHAPGVYVPPPSAPAAAWPSGLATPEQAEDALTRALQERADLARPLQALALRTLGSLSDLERAVLKGKPQPLDPEPIRKAAVLRLRVAEALASAPPPGSPVDSAALSTILGEIDGLLAEVGPLLATAPVELAPALESIRNSLVREAIDFSEAGQRAATTGAPPVQVAARPPPTERAASAKVISVQTPQDAALDRVERRRKVVASVVLAVVALGAIGFHGWREMVRRDVRAPPTLPGAPSNSVASTGSGKVQLVISKTGSFDPAELERFRASEALRGNRVEEISPGVLKVTASEPKK